MQLQQQFDARQVEPQSFAPVPVLGDYHVRIVESEAKPTNDNTGGYIQFDLEILDPGPYLNVKIPYRLNIFNKSQQTVEIAYRQLSALCHITGVYTVQDTRQLHNIPFIATIGPQKDNPQYSNVFGVKDIHGNAPGKQNGAPVAAAPVAAPVAPPAWAPPPQAPPPAAVAPPVWTPPGAPAAPAAAPPVWQPPQAAQPPAPAAPPWGSPQPAAAPPTAPPWAR